MDCKGWVIPNFGLLPIFAILHLLGPKMGEEIEVQKAKDFTVYLRHVTHSPMHDAVVEREKEREREDLGRETEIERGYLQEFSH